MNGYLVLLRHALDDIPVRLFARHRMAVKFAKSLGWWPSRKITKMFPDCDYPIAIDIVKFRDGKPVECESIREYEEETED